MRGYNLRAVCHGAGTVHIYYLLPFYEVCVIDVHCKCLQGFTGALQGFLRTGVLKLKGLHVAGVPCSSLQGFPVCITGKYL